MKFGNRSSSLGDLRGAFAPPPPPAGRVTNQTPAGRGLIGIWAFTYICINGHNLIWILIYVFSDVDSSILDARLK